MLWDLENIHKKAKFSYEKEIVLGFRRHLWEGKFLFILFSILGNTSERDFILFPEKPVELFQSFKALSKGSQVNQDKRTGIQVKKR